MILCPYQPIGADLPGIAPTMVAGASSSDFFLPPLGSLQAMQRCWFF